MGKQKIERRSVRVENGINGPHLLTVEIPKNTLILGGQMWARLHGGIDVELDLGIEVDAPNVPRKLLIAAEGDDLPDIDGEFACQLAAHGVNDEIERAYLFTIYDEPAEEPANG